MQTGPGTAANTGVVLDDSGSAVVGATVTLTPSAGGSALTTTSDSNGAHAFVDIPAQAGGTAYDMTVTKSGYGNYKIINDKYVGDQAYESVVELSSSAQTFNEYDGAITDGTQAAGSTSGAYSSDTVVPPSIRVAIYPQATTCARLSSTATTARNYPWKFYVLHTAVGEINTQWQSKEWKSVAAVIQNYAWYQREVGNKTFPVSGGTVSAQVDNTTNYQCFRPQRKIPGGWATNVTDVMDERLAKTNDSIALTQYRAGSQACQESAFPSNGNILSQWGALARGESNTAACGGDESWRDIDEYYYTSSVVSGSAPAAPTVSTSQIAGGIRINFESVGGWSYELQIFNSGTNTWGGLTKVGWSSSQRAVIKKFDFTTSSCQQYRVRAVGPAGASAYQSTGLTCP